MRKLTVIFLLVALVLSTSGCICITGGVKPCELKSCDNCEMKGCAKQECGGKSIQRFGMVVGIDPDVIDEYKELHADSNPGVRDLLTKYNMQNFSIYLHEIEGKW